MAELTDRSCLHTFRASTRFAAVPAIQVFVCGARSKVRQTLCYFTLFGVSRHTLIIRRRLHHLFARALHAKSFCNVTAFQCPRAAPSAFRNTIDGDMICRLAGGRQRNLATCKPFLERQKYSGRVAAEKRRCVVALGEKLAQPSVCPGSLFFSASSRKVSAMSRRRALSKGSSMRWASLTHSAA